MAANLPGRQSRLLFAYLALHRERAVRRDELAAVLWPEEPPRSADNVLNSVLSRVRKVLGEGVIAGRSQVSLQLPPDSRVDLEEAFEEIQRAELAVQRSEWRTAEQAATLSLTVAERGFLSEADGVWADEARGRLEEFRLRALECLAAAGLGQGGSRLSATERAARTLIEASPYRETGYRYLMQALAERGRVAEALRLFDEFRRLVQEELGVPPSTGLRSLHKRLLSAEGVPPQTEREDPLAVDTATSVLFTDLADHADLDPERVRALRRAHARVLRQAVASQGGRGVTDTGDGLIATFKNAPTAIRCAVEMQQAAELHNRRQPARTLAIRTAVNASGAPAETAKRLCARTEAGQILVADAAPSAAREVLWEPVAPQAFALPPALSQHKRDIFVGREVELERLWGLYERTRTGARQIVLLRGEAGIGKTRLATELALRAQAADAVVAYGRCDEEPLIPHQPFVEALRHYVAACPLAELAGQVGHGSGELRRLVPELAERIPDLAEPLAGDPEGERYRLFEAFTALLYGAAETRPMVLVLDDLHWADKPTLLLLRHLVRYPHDAPLLVLGTYRESELDPGGQLSETLAELSRDYSFERLSLGSLDEDAVTSLVSSHAGREATELIKTILEETEGNPFFVVEMLRHLVESGADGPLAQAGIPDGVKDVIGRRIARLGARTHGVLSIACVSGREFELSTLDLISDLDEDHLIDALDLALGARVIEEVTGCVGRYTFSHALIRQTIYGNLTSARRARLHRRLAAALEEAHAEDLEPYRAELAHHFTEAGSTRDLEKAIDYGARAGDRAAAQLAYEQAATHYRQAVSLIESISPPRQLQRCDLVLSQGEAERRAGDPAYRDTLLDGARLAEALGDAERLARAALANNRGFFSAAIGVDRERVAVLQAALDAQATSDSATRASLLAQLAVELVADPDWPRRLKLSDDALAMARRVGDPTTLLRALNYRYVAIWGPRTIAERVANYREAEQLVAQVEDPVLAFHAATFGAHAEMELGQLERAERLLQRARKLADQLAQPIILWYAAVGRAKRCIISGSPEESEKYAREAFDVGRAAGQLDAFAWFFSQLATIRLLHGTLDGGRPNLLKGAEVGPLESVRGHSGSWSVPLLVEAVHVVTMCELGHTDDARGRFDVLMGEELVGLPHDWTTLAIPAMASLACAHLGDARRAETLYAMLEPHAGQFVDNGPTWLGTTTHYMALVAATMGRLDEAQSLFAEAFDTYVVLGAAPWVARASLDRERTLGPYARRGAT